MRRRILRLLDLAWIKTHTMRIFISYCTLVVTFGLRGGYIPFYAGYSANAAHEEFVSVPRAPTDEILSKSVPTERVQVPEVGLELRLPGNLVVVTPQEFQPISVIQIYEDVSDVADSNIKIEIAVERLADDMTYGEWQRLQERLGVGFDLSVLDTKPIIIDEEAGVFRKIEVRGIGTIWEAEVLKDGIVFRFSTRYSQRVEPLFDSVLQGSRLYGTATISANVYPDLVRRLLSEPEIEPSGMAFPDLKFPFNGTRIITCAYNPDDTNCHPLSVYALDFDLSYETVRAANSGTLVSFWHSCGGSMASITSDEDSSYWMEYAHLSSYLVSNGYVSQGANIAISGDTGSCSSGPHLHINLEKAGVGNIKPEPMCGQTGFLRDQQVTDCWSTGGCCGCAVTSQDSHGVSHADAGLQSLDSTEYSNRRSMTSLVPSTRETPSVEQSNVMKIGTVPRPEGQLPLMGADWLIVRATGSRVLHTPFNWPPTIDLNKDLVGYRVYWGEDANGTGDVFVSHPSFTPDETIDPDQPTVRYLRVAAEDSSGNRRPWQTIAVWRYDPTPPTGTLKIGAGGSTVRTLNVTLNVDATDEGSAVNDMRFSNDGLTWTEWEAFAQRKPWHLADVTEPQTIFAQVRDQAGNISEIMQATVAADLTVDLPASDNYSIVRSVFGMGGGDKTSTSYQVRGITGEGYQTGQLGSSSYQVNSGYWAGTVCSTAEFATGPVISTDGVSVTLSWAASIGATSYNIYRGEVPDFPLDATYDTTTDTSWTDPDPDAIGDPTVNHYYVIRAVNSCGESNTIYRLGAFDFGMTSGQ